MKSSYGGSSSRTSSTPATSNSLRPRFGRLISGLDEGDEVNFNPGTAPSHRIASPLPSSPFESRDPSPIPTRQLTRSTSSTRPLPSAASRGNGAPSRGESPSLSLFFSDSWNALQGKAQEMLGTTSSSPVNTNTHALPKRRKPSHGGQSRNTSAPPAQWGPPSAPVTNLVGIGSREGRETEARAIKRRELLTASPEQKADSLGRFKRRTSDAHSRPYTSAPPGEHEDRDAFVYVHHVQPNDTIAGITIKYNCKDAVLRRANRMWPNDRVQIRKTIILPVDACGVKGRPLRQGEETDLLSGGPESQSNNPFPTSSAPEFQLSPPTTRTRTRTESVSTNSERPLSSGRSSVETEPQWTHDSWVLFPNSKEPTEIARLSRRNLGYFPPARRKSQSFSDLDTPSTSLDLIRTPTMEHSSISPLRQESAQRPRRGRKLSNANNGYFPSYLAGPGGVGTMGKNIKSPGPGQDGLNKLFASHLPNVAPPANQQNLYLPDVPLYSDDPVSTPSLSTPGTQSPSGLGLDNVGGALETWARKMAIKARTALDVPEQKPVARASVGVSGAGGDGVGDLIEMADQFEIGDHEEDEEEERGRQGSATIPIDAARGVSNSASFGQQDTLRSRARSGTSAGAGKRHKDD